MKPPKSLGTDNRANRRVAWWSALLLVALGVVLTALFYSGRYVLSVERQGDSPEVSVLECGLGATPAAYYLLPFHAKPNGAEPKMAGS